MSAIGKRKRCCTIGSSMNRRCEYAWKRWDLSTSLRSHPITAPVRGAGDFLASKSLFQFGKSRFQYSARVDHLALVRNPRPELAANRPRMKIAGRFFVGNFFGDAVDPDLPLEFLP